MSLTIDLSLRKNRTRPWSDDLLLFEPVCSGRVLLPVLAEKVLRGNNRDSAEKGERMQELTTANICLMECFVIFQLNLCPLNL